MEKVRLGIIGLGKMGMPVLKNLVNKGDCPDIEVTAICDASEECIKNAKEIIGEGANVECFKDTEKFLNCKNIDAIYIAVPHYQHPEIAISAFEKKLHVLCEKPAGVYTKNVREMNCAAERAGVKFGMLFQTRTAPTFIKLKEIISSGYYGNIRGFAWIITNWFRSQSYYDSGSWRATWAGEGGGVLLNQCPHNLDLVQWLFGMPEEITAKCSVGQWHKIEVEDDVSAILKYKNGALGTIVTSTGMAPGVNRLEIAMDRATITVENMEKVIVNELAETEAEHIAKGKKESYVPLVTKIEYDFYKQPKGRHAMVLNAFADAILHGGELVADGSEGIKSLMLSNGMYLSAWLDKTITLPFDEDLYYQELKKRIDASKPKEC